MKQVDQMNYLEKFVAQAGAVGALISAFYDNEFPVWLQDELIELTDKMTDLGIKAFIGLKDNLE